MISWDFTKERDKIKFQLMCDLSHLLGKWYKMGHHDTLADTYWSPDSGAAFEDLEPILVKYWQSI